MSRCHQGVEPDTVNGPDWSIDGTQMRLQDGHEACCQVKQDKIGRIPGHTLQSRVAELEGNVNKEDQHAQQKPLKMAL